MFKTFALMVALLTGMTWAADLKTQTVEGVPTHGVEDAPAATAPLQEGKAPRYIIFMIGDGMGLEQVSAALVCNKGKLNIQRLPVTGLSETCSASHLVTDSAAGGTALACGRRTNNKWLGLSPEGTRLVSLADTARRHGKAVGLVVTKAITDATPAAFYAHVDNREKTADIARDLSETPFTVIIGGGAEAFPQESMDTMRGRGTHLNLAAPKHLPPASERGGFLPEQTAEALRVLEQAPEGFFLMIEGSQIDVAGHGHDLREVVCETLDFDRTIGVVLDWMETHPDTLLVITADHQTGGLVIVGGDMGKGRVTCVFGADSHNGVMVPVYAAGVGAERFSGMMKNTDVAENIRSIMTHGCQGERQQER